jgi:octaprenyl-diphosphate synthase
MRLLSAEGRVENVMLDITRVLREEQPRISAVLEREVNRLPASVRPIAGHTLQAGGKRLRPLLAVYMGRLFGCDHPDIYTLAAAIEFVHVATLIHDDVLDNAATRRGIPATHKVYTPLEAILGGDAMLAHAALIVAGIGDAYISQRFAEAVVRIAAGEIDEFGRQGNLQFDYQAYLAMITGKTAWCLNAACRIPAHYAGASPEQVEAAATFGQELGIAFQIVDDALDIAPSADTGKPSGGDLRERKCTPLTTFYLETLAPEEAAVFAEKFTAGSFSDKDIEEITKAMRAKGLEGKTRELAETHLARAREALALLPDNKERAVLALVPEFIKRRRQ